MKTIFTTTLSMLITTFLWAQAPQGIPYQAVMRNADGSVIASSAVSLTFMIHDGTATGAIVYQESHSLTSNAQGLVSCVVGSGVVSQGNFANINWGGGAKFLQVMMGSTDLGTQQMLSVPYALYAGACDVQVSLTGDTLYTGSGNFVIIPGISAANYPAPVLGCTNAQACNYNAAATQDDGSCLYQNVTCDDGNSNTMNDLIGGNCICSGVVMVNGCTNAQACDYNPAANVDNGSCLIQGAACNDGNANTINDVINANCLCAGTFTSGSGTGAQLLPGNATCSTQNISVTGCGGQTSLTYDGRTYDLVEIGGQCWFADNLATDQYRNGDLIPTGLDNTTWQNTTAGAYAIYNNDPTNDATYGKLYNWYTTVDTRGLCPTGWHVPTDCEWMYLESSLGMSVADQETAGWRGTNEGGALKATNNWPSPNTGATNSSGFTALPGGFRDFFGTYNYIGSNGFWWSSTGSSSSIAWNRILYYYDSYILRQYLNLKQDGVSIRCLKDSDAPMLQGCTDGSACNFLANATQDDGSCLYQNATCDDGNANTMNDVIGGNCICSGVLMVNGCTNAQACNYNPAANVDNGSCLIQGTTCNDGNASTTNDVINANCQCAGTSTSGSGTGAQLLPGNATCSTQNISVTGCGGQTSLTYDGRTYDLVEIGGQCWFADNLATDQYRNGDPIPTGLDNTTWQNTTTGAYAIYNNDPANDVTYGKLYNWYTTVDTRGLCPTGWHVPTDCEWMYLESSLGMSVADQETAGWRGTTEGGALKATTNWTSPNTGATNSSGFTALPGGDRFYNGSYHYIGFSSNWWSSTEFDYYSAWYRFLYYINSDVGRFNGITKQDGFSVRCLRD